MTKESAQFPDIQRTLERRIEKKKHKESGMPRRALEPSPDEPMQARDYALALRGALEPHQTDTDQEKTKTLRELLPPPLMKEYSAIVRTLGRAGKITKDHPARELADPEEEHIAQRIEEWIDHAADALRQRLPETTAEEEEMRQLSRMLFDAIATVVNTRSIEADIDASFAEKDFVHLPPAERDDEVRALGGFIAERYRLSPAEAEILVSLIRSKHAEGAYDLGVLIDTVKQLTDTYRLGEHRGKIAKLSAGFLTAELMGSYAPKFFEDIVKDNQFNVGVFLEFLGLNRVAELLYARMRAELLPLRADIRKRINERIVNSLFFQEFEFIHDEQMGRIFTVFEKGKDATEQLISKIISQVIPTLSGMGFSLAFLTKINPILGSIGIAGIPAMYAVARQEQKKTGALYRDERGAREDAAAILGSVQTGLEEMRTSPGLPGIATYVTEQMNREEDRRTRRIMREIKADILTGIPHDISSVLAAAVGAVLQRIGIISGGAAFANIIYAQQLNGPIRRLVDTYFREFPESIQDIQRMEEILGQYEKLDLPEGKKEQERIPASALPHTDLSIKNIRVKHILRDVTLHINQGELLAIAGPSGAGKSTLLRAMVGLLKPEAGAIEIGGAPVESIKKYGADSLYAMLAYANQKPQLFPDMTLRQNLKLWTRDDVGDDAIRQMLSDLGMEKFIPQLDKNIKHLSGGELVRLGVARALLKQPKILLLDEPTASLDSSAGNQVREMILKIKQEHPEMTIVCVSHDDTLVKRFQEERGRVVDIESLGQHAAQT